MIDRRNDNATLYFDKYSIPKIIITWLMVIGLCVVKFRVIRLVTSNH